MRSLALDPTTGDLLLTAGRLTLVEGVEAVAQRIITNLGNHAGGTVLLHDTHPWSVAAMPKIIRWLERENAAREQAGRAPYVVLDPARYLEGATRECAACPRPPLPRRCPVRPARFCLPMPSMSALG